MMGDRNITMNPESFTAKALLVISIVVELYTAISGILFVFSSGPEDDLPFIVNAVATYVRYCFI